MRRVLLLLLLLGSLVSALDPATLTGKIRDPLEVHAENQFYVSLNCITNDSEFLPGDILVFRVRLCYNEVCEHIEQMLLSWEVPCYNHYGFKSFVPAFTQPYIYSTHQDFVERVYIVADLKRIDYPDWQVSLNETIEFEGEYLVGDTSYGEAFRQPPIAPPPRFVLEENLDFVIAVGLIAIGLLGMGIGQGWAFIPFLLGVAFALYKLYPVFQP